MCVCVRVCPLRFLHELKGSEFWQAVIQMLDIQQIVDLTPGSGTLASACLQLQTPYTGFLKSDVHHSFLANVLDRQALYHLSDHTSFFHNSDLAELIEDHFGDTLAELNQPDLSDGSENEEA